jgi:hypothetical protein
MLWHTLILVDDASSHEDSVVGRVRECRGRRTVAGVDLQKKKLLHKRKMSRRPFFACERFVARFVPDSG